MTDIEGLAKWKRGRSALLLELRRYERDDVEIPYDKSDELLHHAVQLLLEADSYMPMKEKSHVKDQEDQWLMHRHVLLQYLRRYEEAEVKIPCREQKKLLFSAVDLLFEADRLME